MSAIIFAVWLKWLLSRNNTMEARLGKQDLIAALTQASVDHPDLKIPHSYRSLIRLEKTGVIPVCGSPLRFKSGRTWRLYTQEEIDTIVTKVVEYKTKR